MLSKKNNGKSAIVPGSSGAKIEPGEVFSSKETSNAVARSATEKPTVEKSEPTPSAVAVEKSLKTEEKDSAPIFALFHGKIVPLGKLPDTSFKKSQTETRNHENENKDQNRKEASKNSNNQENDKRKSEIKEHEQQEEKSDSNQESASKKKEQPLSPSQFVRLSSYFHNLDSKGKASVETRMIKSHKKDVTGTAKDEVPELLPAMKNSEFLKHVKGIVMDDGKLMTFKGKQPQIEEQKVNMRLPVNISSILFALPISAQL